MSKKQPLNPILKLALDIGPLVLFFAANARFGIFTATAAFMAAVLVALAVSYALTRRLAVMPLVTAVIVLFGGTLLAGLLLGKPFLSILFDQMFHLTDEGWRKLTWRWVAFFFALAVLNEVVWRNFSTDAWVSFKLFGVVPLTFLFGALQYPLLTKYHAEKS